MFIAPLLSNTAHDSPEKSDSNTVQVQVLGLILELLSFFVEHHTYHIKNYILHKGKVTANSRTCFKMEIFQIS